MRPVKYTKQQKIAYHEAAHVVAHVRHEIPFLAVYLEQNDGTITLSDGTIKTDFPGVVEYDPKEAYARMGTEKSDDFLTKILSGLAAEKILAPHRSYDWFIDGQAAQSDWLNALEFVEGHHQQVHKNLEAFFARIGQKIPYPKELSFDIAHLMLKRQHLPKARSFVKAEWENIIKIGDALIASPKRKLRYRKCKRLLAATTAERATA